MGPMNRPLARAAAAALALTALAAALPSPALAQEPLPDVEAVMDYIDDLYRSESSHAVMVMTVVNERGTRELELESWSRGDDEGLVVIREPPREAGTATLRTDDGLWNYAPRADRLIRIPSGLLSESWMGSHFTNDDLTPKPDAPVVYSRLVFLIRPGDWVPLRAEYYDEGTVIRTMIFEDVQTVDGKPIPMTMILRPEDEPDERTVVAYRVLELDVPVEASMFTRQGLRRVAR